MSGQLNKSDNGGAGRYAELPLRIVSAIVLAAFALFCTWMGGQTFLLLAAVLAFLIFAEFTFMVKTQLPARITIFAFGFLLIVISAFVLQRPDTGLIILGLGAAALALWELVSRRSIWGSIALAYAGLPFIALVQMREGASGLFVILFVFACVWGADTFAYFFGKTLGGPKLAPAISPNKTWSGFIGGFVGAIGVSVILEIAFGFSLGLSAVLLAATLALASQIGDLFESWVKRRFGHKDSGRIIPGHGGILDRIDGLIFAIVAVWLLGLASMSASSQNSALSDILMYKFITVSGS